MIARVGWGLSSSRAIVLVAFVLGLLLRCFGVDAHELQYDEAATRYFSTLPWPDLWGAPALLEPNPPLFYSLAWLITHAGGSPEQIRYISVIAGSLCVPMAWLIAGRTAGAARDRAGASAALLVATSPQNIAMSQYARAYALLILCVMCAFFCILQARRLAFAPTPPERAWNRAVSPPGAFPKLFAATYPRRKNRESACPGRSSPPSAARRWRPFVPECRHRAE